MPANQRTPWLVCYDIADPKRLCRVRREISRRAIPFQYSVFRTNTTRRHLARALDEVARHIDPRQDDLRAYPLLTSARPFIYGRSFLPEGVELFDLPDLFFDNTVPLDERQRDGVEFGVVRSQPSEEVRSEKPTSQPLEGKGIIGTWQFEHET